MNQKKEKKRRKGQISRKGFRIKKLSKITNFTVTYPTQSRVVSNHLKKKTCTFKLYVWSRSFLSSKKSSIGKWIATTCHVRGRFGSDRSARLIEGHDHWTFPSLQQASRSTVSCFTRSNGAARLAEMYKLIYFMADNPSFPQQPSWPLASNFSVPIRNAGFCLRSNAINRFRWEKSCT